MAGSREGTHSGDNPALAVSTEEAVSTAEEDSMADTNIGRFVWYELMTTDPKAAIAFYGDVIGWKAQPWESGALAPRQAFKTEGL